jgi:hypothetical protein
MTSSTASIPVPLAVVSGTEREPPAQPLKRHTAASAYLKEVWGIEHTPGTLAKKAVTGGGPRFRRAGRVPYYAPPDLDTYARQLLSKAVTSTSELRGECPDDGRSEAATQSGSFAR